MAFIKQYYSDIISEQQIINWINNKSKVLLSGGTGTGKSHFINTKLADILSKNKDADILYLCNRSKLKGQELDLIKDLNLDYYIVNKCKIYVFTYQHLEQKTMQDIRLNIECGIFDCIVCDEAHYFINDSWNGNTSILFDIVKDVDTPVIYLSATPDLLLNELCFDEIIQIPQDYSYVNLIPFNKSSEELEIINMLLAKGDKTVVFVDNIDRAINLYNSLYQQHDIKICFSRYGEKTAKYQHLNCIDSDFIVNGILQTKLLITTSVIDNGINIIDSDVRNFVIDLDDRIKIHQCIGRKRITSADDNLNVYMFNAKCELEYKLQQAKIEYTKKDNSYLYSAYLKDRIQFLTKSRSGGLCYAFYDYIKDSGMKLLDNYTDYMRDKKIIDTLETYEILYTYLYDDVLQDFIKDLDIKKDYKLVKGFSQINDYIKKYGYSLRKERKRIKGKQITVWLLCADNCS